jgi:UDP-N-acetylglucosamine 3-dehydrogenase
VLKIGVIGTGVMGKHHARVYSTLNNVKLVGVADLNVTTANAIANEYHTKAYTDYKELIRVEKPDAVTIAVPTAYHRDVALYALDQGVHVLVEKPIAHTVAAAREIVSKAKEKNLKLMVGHIERFNPAIRELKKTLTDGVIGDVVSMSARRVGPFTNRITDVGVIVDVGVHDIDVISHLFNDSVAGVYTTAGDMNGSPECYAMMMLRFKNGGTGIIETNRMTPRKIRELTVTGTKGVAFADYIEQTLSVHNGVIYKPDIQKVEPLKAELEHFIDCVENNKTPLVNGVEGTHALEVALAAVSSYKNNSLQELNNNYLGTTPSATICSPPRISSF